MAEIVVELKGFDEAIAWLERAPETANSLFAEAVERGLQAIAGRVKAYPPATEANRPGRVTRDGRPMGYYERGQGWWYPVKQAKTLGGVRLKSAGVRPLGRKAAKQMGAVGYKLIRSSERLREHWTTRIEKLPDGVEGVIGTGVSYAGAVEGFVSQDPRQARLPASRGWPSLETAFREGVPDIEAALGEAVQRLADEFNKGR